MRKFLWPVLCVVLFLGLATLSFAQAKPNVVIMATGGTIAGAAKSSTQTTGYTAAVTGVDQLIANVPEIKNVANVTGEQLFQISSENMTTDHWLKMAQRVNEVLKDSKVDGIVITHGTDTIEETAYFLNLVVKSDKPVVLVGAMRPGTSLSADGQLNLYRGVILAGSKDARGKGVLVMLNDQISAGRDVTKTSTTQVETFQNQDMGFLGVMTNTAPTFYRLPIRKHTTATEFDVSRLKTLPQVDIVYGYAGNNDAMLKAAVSNGAKGIVYAGTGNGNISAQVQPTVDQVVKKGVVFVRSNRTGSGITTRNNEYIDDDHGTIAGDNLNPQKARILLMLALTKTKDAKEIQRMFWEY
jgi:L-asparaginase